MKKENKKSEWDDSVAVIIRKPKMCDSCKREDLTIGDWIEQIIYKLERNDSVVIKSNRRNLATFERVIRILKIVGVREIENRRVEVREFKHYYKNKPFKTEITAAKLEKIPALKGIRL